MMELEDTENELNEWQTTRHELKHRGAYLLESGEWSDLTIYVGKSKVPFKVHKLILCMASPGFVEMVNGTDKETTCLHFHDVSSDAFAALLKYIYTENITINRFDLACEIFLAANKFMVPQLASVCATYMVCNLSKENACQAYELGILYYNQMLIRESSKNIKLYINDILYNRSLEEVSVNTVTSILGIADLPVKEMDLFKALERYYWKFTKYSEYSPTSPCELKPIMMDYTEAQDSQQIVQSAEHQSDNEAFSKVSRNDIREALHNIRFLTLTLEEFATIAQSPLFEEAEALSIMLHIACSDRAHVPMPAGFSTSKEPRFKYDRRTLRRPSDKKVSVRLSMRVPLSTALEKSTHSDPYDVLGRGWRLHTLPSSVQHLSGITRNRLNLYIRCAMPDQAAWCSVQGEFVLVAKEGTPGDDRRHPFHPISFTTATYELHYTCIFDNSGTEQPWFTKYVHDGDVIILANITVEACAHPPK